MYPSIYLSAVLTLLKGLCAMSLSACTPAVVRSELATVRTRPWPCRTTASTRRRPTSRSRHRTSSTGWSSTRTPVARTSLSTSSVSRAAAAAPCAQPELTYPWPSACAAQRSTRRSSRACSRSPRCVPALGVPNHAMDAHACPSLARCAAQIQGRQPRGRADRQDDLEEKHGARDQEALPVGPAGWLLLRLRSVSPFLFFELSVSMVSRSGRTVRLACGRGG